MMLTQSQLARKRAKKAARRSERMKSYHQRAEQKLKADNAVAAAALAAAFVEKVMGKAEPTAK